MQASERPRSFPAFECDHMRPKVRVGDDWHHITHEGGIGSICAAGTYKVAAIYMGHHTLDRLVLDADD